MSVGFSALFYLMNYNSIKTHRCVGALISSIFIIKMCFFFIIQEPEIPLVMHSG